MPTVLQFRRGTTAQNNSFTGSAGELSIDTELDIIRVHDGSTPGGFSLVGLNCVQTITTKTLDSTNILDNVAIVNGIRNGNANGVGNIGNASTYFNTAFVKATSAQYADVAERYLADADYPVGTVLMIGGDKEVTQSTRGHMGSIAGTVSENPAYIMNSGMEGDHVVTIALLGRVPCRVVGKIARGACLVSSDIPGVATQLDDSRYRHGCVIGKALQSYDSAEPGVIEIVVGRL